MRSRAGALAAALALTLIAGLGVQASPAQAAVPGAVLPGAVVPGAVLPGAVLHFDLELGDLELGNSQQVIIVTARSWGSRTGTVTAYQVSAGGGWEPVLGPMRAMLGHSGLIRAAQRRQGTGKTPTGTFRIVSAFGRQPDPGTSMPYLRIDRDDAWTYHPKVPSTYNMLQTAPRSWRSYGGYVEHLWSYGVQYDYVAVMDYNLPGEPIRTGADGVRRTSKPADTARGGGIFLHASNGKVTAGCIAVPVGQMRAIMRWLDPAKDPRIVVRVDPAD